MFHVDSRRRGQRRFASLACTPLPGRPTGLPDYLCEPLEPRLLLAAANYQNPMWFKPWQPYGVGSDPISVQVADLGNGHPDLVALNAGDGTVSVLLGNGKGAFAPQRAFPVGTGPTAFAIADVNHDGKPDLIVANFDGVAGDSGTVSVLLGNGDGTFGPPQKTVLAGSDPLSLAVADVNGDGNPDVIVANSGTNPDGSAVNIVSVLLGNSNGTFQPAYAVATDLAPRVVTTADLNHDGKVDLIVGGTPLSFSAVSIPVEVLKGDGNGAFQPCGLLAGLFYSHDQVSSIAVADLDGDGKLDLLIGEQETGQFPSSDVLTAYGNGDGTFESASELLGVDGDFVAAADLTGNGETDVLGLDTRSAWFDVQVSLYHGTEFLPLAEIDGTSNPNQPTFNSPVWMTVADVNGDGRPDIMVADSGDNTVGVFLNSTVKPSLAPRVASTTFGVTLINGDRGPGGVSVKLTNTSSHTWVTGIGGIDVYACDDGVIDGNQTPVAGAVSVSLDIGPGKSITLQFPTDVSLTSGLAIGTYTLLAEVTDPYDNTIDQIAGGKLKVVPLAPIVPPPNPADTFTQVIGSAHGMTVPLVWYTTGLGVGASDYKSEVLLTGGTGSVYSDANGAFDMELKGNCSLTIVSAVPQYEFPDLDLGTVAVTGNLVLLNAPSSNLLGQVHVTGSLDLAILSNITGSLLVDGSIGNLRAENMSGDISAGANIGTLQLAQVSGTIAAGRSLGSLAAMSLTNAKVIAGAVVSNVGVIIDPSPGTIGSISISGAIAQSFIGVGVDPLDGIYGNGNDNRFATGPSRLSTVAAASVDSSSVFEAAMFGTVRIDGKLVALAADARFRTLL